ELRFKKGDQPFTMLELFRNIRKAIWQEVNEGTNINSFRRELQRMHLYVLKNMVVKTPPTYPHDAVTLARADLVAIKNKIEENLTSENLDPYTTAHLQETKAKIEAALDAQVQAGI
ncbi:MAG: peptidase M43, partial [Aliifodinibius sp.]|nr:peptidase M43 [Fodinibius sp.]